MLTVNFDNDLVIIIDLVLLNIDPIFKGNALEKFGSGHV